MLQSLLQVGFQVLAGGCGCCVPGWMTHLALSQWLYSDFLLVWRSTASSWSFLFFPWKCRSNLYCQLASWIFSWTPLPPSHRSLMGLAAGRRPWEWGHHWNPPRALWVVELEELEWWLQNKKYVIILAVSHKNWELPNSRIWLVEIDIEMPMLQRLEVRLSTVFWVL